MRVAFVQFGSFAEAVKRFAAGHPETYYAQKYSVDFVARLARQVDEVSVVHLVRDDPEERLSNGVLTVGVELFPPGRWQRRLELIRILRRLRPDHIVLMCPLPFVLSWALVNRIRVLPRFADSFNDPALKVRLTSAALASLLNRESIDWVSNHNVAAALDLARIGVSPHKVLAHDWPALMTPNERPAKEPPSSPVLRAFYVGQTIASKGVNDLIEAVRLLGASKSGRPWRLTIAGATNEALMSRVHASGVGERVDIIGPVPHDRVVPLMNDHDVVVVPSHHEYPEGLPMAIYEGVCSRTPLVVSDHPMFRLKVCDGDNALVFPAGRPAALANCLDRLGRDPDLYRRLSARGGDSEDDFLCPLKYDVLVQRWLSGTAEDRRFLSTYSLTSGRYDGLLSRRGVRVPPSVPLAPVRVLLRSVREGF